MAIKSLKSSAWQDIDTLKVPVSGAYQVASSAKALVSGAWKDVWTAGHYFVKGGVLMNGATKASSATQGNGSIYTYTDSSGLSSLSFLYFKLTEDMLGKKIYVKASTNVTGNYMNGEVYLIMGCPTLALNTQWFYCTQISSGLISFIVPTNYKWESSINACIEVRNSYNAWVNYHIYDVYVA